LGWNLKEATVNYFDSFAAKLATVQGSQAASFQGTQILVRSNFMALQKTLAVFYLPILNLRVNVMMKPVAG
jgi:hypothetical protein